MAVLPYGVCAACAFSSIQITGIAMISAAAAANALHVLQFLHGGHPFETALSLFARRIQSLRAIAPIPPTPRVRLTVIIVVIEVVTNSSRNRRRLLSKRRHLSGIVTISLLTLTDMSAFNYMATRQRAR